MLIRDLATGETRRVVDYGGMFFPMTWSLDGKSVTVVELQVEHEHGSLRPHRRQRGDAAPDPARGRDPVLPGPWAVDGSGFYVISDEGREFAGLAFWDLKEGSALD